MSGEVESKKMDGRERTRCERVADLRRGVRAATHLPRMGLGHVGTALVAAAATLLFAAPAMSQGNPPVLNNAPAVVLPAACSHPPTVFAVGAVVMGSANADLVMLCGTDIITLPGNNDGTFATGSAKTTALSSSFYTQIALADIDGDGKLDVVTDDSLCNVDVYLGNGDGTFQTSPVEIPEPTYCGGSAEPFVVGDFNGKPGLVLENIYGEGISLTVFLNTSTPGAVSFSHNNVALNLSSSQMLEGVAVGNFAGNGVADLALGITSREGGGDTDLVEVLENNGSGTAFTLQSTITLPQTANTAALSGIAAGDFNGDGKMDVAVADPGNGAIFVLDGDGHGDLTSCSSPGMATSIAPCQETGVGQTIVGLPLEFSSGLVAGNFNGLPGVAFKNVNDGFSVLLGAAGGSLQTAAGNYVAGPDTSALALADLNGDGAPDVIFSAENGLSVFLNNTAGVFEGTQAFTAGTAPAKISLLTNFFGNGEQDVAVAQNGSAAITVIGAPATGANGTLPQMFGPESLGASSTAGVTAMTSGCLENSSPCASPFVAAATYDTNSGISSIDIIYITSGGPSAPTTIYNSPPASPPVTGLAAGDFNGDGKTDLVFDIGGYNELLVAGGNGDGTFGPNSLTMFGVDTLGALAVADFNGDGKPDIAVLAPATGGVGILLNTSSSASFSFGSMATYPDLLFNPTAITVGDFDNNGKPDVAVLSPDDEEMTILLNQGGGVLADAPNSPIQFVLPPAGGIATGDFNGDGFPDLAATVDNGNDSVEIFNGDGTGNFATTTSPTYFSAGSGPNALAVADFNGDGKPDIAVADESGNMVSLLLNGTAAATTPPPPPTQPYAQYSDAGPINFGAVQVNTTGTEPLTLTNTGSSAFIVSGISLQGSSSAFSITNVVCNNGNTVAVPYSSISVTLGAGQTCTITLQFLPTLDQNGYAEDLVVATTATNSNAAAGPGGTGQAILLVGDGVEPYASFSNTTTGSPSQITFGNVTENSPSIQTVTVTNTGDGPLTIQLVLIGGGASGFSDVQFVCSNGASSASSSPYPITLNPANPAPSCTYTVQFDPRTAGPLSGSLGFADNAGVGESNLTSTNINGTSFQQNLPLSGTGISSAPPPPATIAVSETITVSDAPTFPDVAIAEPITVKDAVTLTPLLSVNAPVAIFSTSSLGFGNVAAAQTGTQTILVSNEGEGQSALTLDNAAIDSGVAYSIESISCSNGATSFPTMLPSGGACVITILYMAPSAGLGPANAMLTFTDNAALSNLPSAQNGSDFVQIISLNGSGTTTPQPGPPQTTASVSVSEVITVTDTPTVTTGGVMDTEPTTVGDAVTVVPLLDVNAPVASFSTSNLGFNDVAGTQIISVANSGVGAAPLSLTSVATSLLAQRKFTVDSIACTNGATSFPTVLSSGGECLLAISYNPQSAGVVPGALTFTDNADLSNLASTSSGSNYTQTISLKAAGTTAPQPGPPQATVILPAVAEPVTVGDAATVVAMPAELSDLAPVAYYSVSGLGFPALHFGESETENLTVSNIGGDPLVLASAVISLGPPFTVAQVACTDGETALPATLQPEEGCILTISYRTPLTPPSNATITITDNAKLSNLASTLVTGFSSSGIIPYTQSVSLVIGSVSSAANASVSDTETVGATDTAVVTLFSPSTITLTASATSVAIGGSATFKATVASAFPGTPTGTVTVMNGTTVIYQTTLSGTSGVVTTPAITSFATGANVITATYSGDTHFSGSTTSTVVTVGAPDYSITANPSTLTLAAGQSGSTTLMLTANQFGFVPGIALSCGNLPFYITCTFTPPDGPTSTVTLIGQTPAKITLTVAVAKVLSAKFEPRDSAPLRRIKPPVFALALMASLGLVGLLPLWRRNHARWMRFAGALLLCVAIGGAIAGCAPETPPAGAQSITINASGGGDSHPIPLTITITN